MPNVVEPTVPNYPPQGIQAQLDLLYLYNPNAVNTLIKEINTGLTQVTDLQKKLENALENLPASDVTRQWVTDNFINADASTYILATLADAFNYSNARLYKLFNEDDMPTKDSYTLFSLGWTYQNSNNAPTLLAANLANGDFYYYHGLRENCKPDAWKKFAFGGIVAGTELPDQKDNAGKVLTTDGNQTSWQKIKIADNEATASEGQILVKTSTGAEWKPVDTSSIQTASDVGMRGDYCSTYAVIRAPNGLPKIKSGATNTVTIPAGLVLDCPLSTDVDDVSKGLITIASQHDVEIMETVDGYLVYVQALGEVRFCNTICFMPSEPSEDNAPCKMWFNGQYWQFKSDDTGNVWRKTRAQPLAKCIFTGNVLTRLNYIGWYDIAPLTEV